MMMQEHFFRLIEAIEALGYDRETAGHYAIRISDCVCRDEDGMVLVIEGGKVLAKLDLRDYYGGIDEK